MISGAELAAGELSGLADALQNAGLAVRLPAAGILQAVPAGDAAARPSVLVSVGIHGDETAPIELLAELLAQVAAAPRSLRVNLMVVVGNLAAIAAGKRYLDVDLNRLFVKDSAEEGGQDRGQEGPRADLILRATQAFFGQPCSARWHLDLHTAIRASHYPAFAIVPDVFGDAGRAEMLGWLAAAHVQAAVLNRQLAGTYSAYTALQFGAIACTGELGSIGVLGKNDLTPFRPAQAALAALLTASALPPGPAPKVFEVAQELVKRSADFRFAFDAATANFSPLPPGALIAQDGAAEWRVGARTEYSVFTNAAVALGKRAGLMVVERD